jgi:uncharacterized protein (TIGR03435 family)
MLEGERNLLNILPAAIPLTALFLQALFAQSAGPPPSFDVASIKQNKSNDRPRANFPLGPGDVYIPNGGLFSARNFPLITYIAFAYKMNPSQIESLRAHLPDWVTTDRYDIQARADGNPSKDEMRSMVGSLLADRFKLAIHSESRQVTVYALVVVKPGKTGPHLQPHPADSPCSTAPLRPDANTAAPPQAIPEGLPAVCGGNRRIPPTAPGRVRWGARNVTIGLIADALADWGNLGRRVLDQTNLTGTFDFTLEWTPEFNGPMQPHGGAGSLTQSMDSGPTFQEALKQQLGLKLQSQASVVDVLIADHVERPSEN